MSRLSRFDTKFLICHKRYITRHGRARHMEGKNSRQQVLRAARARTSLAGVLGLGRLDRFVAQAGRLVCAPQRATSANALRESRVKSE